MKISVITVVYNARETIQACLESVMSQSYTEIEQIIVDGASTDGTVEIIEQCQRRPGTFISEKDDGLYDAINKGISLATGDIIGLLHADDIFYDNESLEHVVQAFQSSGADMVYGHGQYIDQEGRVRRIYKAGTFRKRRLKFGWIPLHTAIYVKKAVFDNQGVYVTQFRIAGDYEISLRWFLDDQLKKVLLARFLVKMRLGGKSTTARLQKLKSAEDLMIIRKYQLWGPVTLFFKIARKIPQYLTPLVGCRWSLNKNIFCAILVVLTIFGRAQENSVYLNHSYRPFDRYLYRPEHRFHTAVRPFNMNEVNAIVQIDTLYPVVVNYKTASHWLNNDLVRFKSKDFEFTLNPDVDFELSQYAGDSLNGFINARGLRLHAKLKDKIVVHSTFYEIQSRFRGDRLAKIQELGDYVVPGQNRGRDYGAGVLDYAYSEAYLSFLASEMFQFQLGHGKHFLGDGYRSLLLSDNAMSYPYFKMTSTFWHIKYVNLWSQHAIIEEPLVPNKRFLRKWNVMHYLDWSVAEWLNVGLFETIVWQHEDSLGFRGFELNYVNPVIFLRPVEFTIGSPDNVLMGLTAKATLCKKHIFFGQFILDEFRLQELKGHTGWWSNKYGFQAGYKTFDLAGIDRLDFHTEFNYVRPFTYSHFHPLQNYGHLNQSLAHPRGSNFYESVSFLRYRYKRWFAEAKVQYLAYGTDTAGSNMGNDIFKLYSTRTQDYGHFTAQSAYSNHGVLYQTTLSYLLNPRINLLASFGIQNRTHLYPSEKEGGMLYLVSLSTRLNNHYFDW